MSNITRRALRVYAALTELRGNNDDILDALIPFFDPVLSAMDGKVFEPRLVSLAMQRLYRWRFTRDVAEKFIPRLVRHKMLERVVATRETVYIVRYQPPALSSNEAPIAADLNRIIDEFEKFPPRVTDLLLYERSREELTDILVRFLVSMDAYSEVSFVEGLGRLNNINQQDRTLLEQMEEGGTPLHRDDRYMAARFVQYICKKTPSYVPILVRLSSIGLLTEVVEDFIRPTQTAAKTNLTVILDAPLALDYLGCSGTAFKSDIRTIVTSLTAIGCKFVVFPVSCVEMRRNLQSMLGNSPTKRHGYTHDALMKNEVQLDFVRAVANDPEAALRQAGIEVKPLSLFQFPNSYSFFDSSRYEDYFESIYWVPDVAPREHDAECVTLTMRLREGKHSSDIFRSNYVFVSRNPKFVKSSREYCEQARLITSIQEGPVIHQRELATVAWLRTGLGAANEIPRGHLIASCEHILRFRPEVRDAVAAKLREVTPENIDQFELLLSDAKSLRRLADATLNDENLVTAENAAHLLSVMKQASIAEEKAIFDTAIAEERGKHVDQQALAQREKALLAGERDKAVLEIAQAKKRVDRVIARTVRRTNKLMHRLELCVTGLLLVLCAAGIVDLLWGYLTGSRIWGTVLVLAGAVGTYHLVMDVLQKPKIGMSTILNWLANALIQRDFQRSALEGLVETDKIVIKGGQITVSGIEIEELTDSPARIEPRLIQ